MFLFVTNFMITFKKNIYEKKFYKVFDKKSINKREKT